MKLLKVIVIAIFISIGWAALFLLIPEAQKVDYGIFIITIPPAIIFLFFNPFRSLMVLLLFAGILSPNINLGIASMYLHQWVILIASSGIIISTLIIGRVAPKLKPPAGGFPLFAVPATIAFLASFIMVENNIEAIKTTMYIGVLFLGYYLTSNSIKSWKQLQMFFLFAIFGLVLTSIVAIAKSGFSFGKLYTYSIRNTNGIGHFLLITTSIWLSAKFFGIRFFKSYILIISGIILSCFTIILSASRATWLGLCCAMLAAIVTTKRIRVMILMIVFSLISIVIITQVHSFMFNKLGKGGSSGINYRVKKIEMAWDMFFDSPIVGNGPGSFLARAKKRPEREIREHATLESTYPYIAAEFGLLGIICTLITFYIVWKMYTKIPDVKNDIRKKLAKVVMCMCFGVLVAQVGENTIFFPKINWLIGSYIGLLPVLRRLPEKTDNMANYNFRNY